jgi:hypothetical protein
MRTREEEAAYQRLLDSYRAGMRRPGKTDKGTDILLVGGPFQPVNKFQCKIGATTFSLDRPDRIPGWNPFDGGTGSGMRMRRYLYKVREIGRGWPFVVGDYVECDKW